MGNYARNEVLLTMENSRLPGSMDSSSGLPKSSCCLKYQGQGLWALCPGQSLQFRLEAGSSAASPYTHHCVGTQLLKLTWPHRRRGWLPSSPSSNTSRRQGQLQCQPTSQKTHMFYVFKKLTFTMLLFREDTERVRRRGRKETSHLRNEDFNIKL